MKIAFTICSNNYLAQAKTLGDSLLKHNPDYKFFIGLVDILSGQINYSDDIIYEVIPIETIGIINFEELYKKYNIVELNTSVKPSLFRFLLRKYPDLDFLLYFDPDIMIFDKISDIESEFKENDFILTPHIFSPMAISNQRPNEYDFLNYGIYNIGFLGLKNSKQIINDFLPWWEERTLKLGNNNPSIGLFVDQLWFNIVPLFFKKICILNHYGCNVAPWNLHERELASQGDKFIVNNEYNLIFFHFSSFKYKKPEIFFYNYNRNLEFINGTIECLYYYYCKRLLENRVEKYSFIKCYYVELNENFKDDHSLKRRVKKGLKPILPISLINKIKRAINW